MACFSHHVTSALLILLIICLSVPMLLSGVHRDTTINRSFFPIQSCDSTGNVSAMTQLIPPCGTIYSFWIGSNCFEVLYIFYYAATRLSEPRFMAHEAPCLLTPILIATFMVNQGVNSSWLTPWDQFGLVTWILGGVTLIEILYLVGFFVAGSMGKLDMKHKHAEGRGAEVAVARILVSNSIAIYITWTAFPFLFLLGILFSDNEDPTAFANCWLAVVGSVYTLFVIIDLRCALEVTRFTFSPYVIVFLTLATVIKNWDLEQDPELSNSLWVLTVLSAVALTAKVLVSYWQPWACRKLKGCSSMEDDEVPHLSVKK